jgi:hypothetical protein
MTIEPVPEFDGMVDAGEDFEVHEESYAVSFFGLEYRAWPPKVSTPRIQQCPRCGNDCREEAFDLWACDHCGYREDNRALIRKDMPRRRRKHKRTPR